MSKENRRILEFMDDTFKGWLCRESITHNELYQFLHTIKELSEKEKLYAISTALSDMIETFHSHERTLWSKREWQQYTSSIISLVDKVKVTNVLDLLDSDGTELSKEDFILLVDDDVTFVTLAKQLLENEGFLVIVAPNGKRALEMIYDFKPSLILIDIHLPDIDGFTILQNIVVKARKSYIPIALISAADNKANRLMAYQLGAIDFIPKPIDQDLFIANVYNRLAHRKEVEKYVITDELTGLYNRKYMNTQIIHYFNLFRKDRGMYSIILLDLDHFKFVNDTYGHIVGDEVLREFASLAQSIKREQDIICRYGGEEFVILLPNTTREQTKAQMAKLQEALKQKDFLANDTRFQVTFSAGISVISSNNLHIEKLLDEADKALYFAKNAGRNQVAFYNQSLQTSNHVLRLTIVIVEDSYLIRKVLMKYLSKWNSNKNLEINFIEFNNGVTFLASEWYKPTEKYVILLDGIMPEMDGLEVLVNVRENYPRDNILISMLTGRKGEEHILNALRNGADDYIVKPFDTEEVFERILRLIKRVFV
ncbi:diguanylate cyclase [Bacillus solitudinis]|uniref:diguanylate cyclase n=1 Tax=Bacillus solitudinis TaxID=2014074 RepID=UPI0018E1E8CE|nr:diguanylate cyclase [Bacillus solitudinis]